MVPNLFRMLALASAVLIGAGYIWWASGRKAVEPGGAAVEAIAGANPNEEDVNPNAPIPTTIMLSSKRIEMPVFSKRGAGEPASPVWELDRFETFVESVEAEPSEWDPSTLRVVRFKAGVLAPRVRVSPPDAEEAEEIEDNPPLSHEASEPGSILAPDTLETGPEATPQQP